MHRLHRLGQIEIGGMPERLDDTERTQIGKSGSELARVRSVRTGARSKGVIEHSTWREDKA